MRHNIHYGIPQITFRSMENFLIYMCTTSGFNIFFLKLIKNQKKGGVNIDLSIKISLVQKYLRENNFKVIAEQNLISEK